MPANTAQHVGNELMIRRLLVQVPSALMGRDIFRLVVRSSSGRHSTSTSVVACGACHHNHRGLHGWPLGAGRLRTVDISASGM